MKKFLFILLFFINSCGYQPIYLNKNLENYEFQEIIQKGDRNINKKIINTLSIKKKSGEKNLSKLFIFSTIQTNGTSKNSKGQIESFRTVVNVNLEIKDSAGNSNKNKNFEKQISYNNKENKFELIEYQNSITKNIIDDIIEDIVIFLNTK